VEGSLEVLRLESLCIDTGGPAEVLTRDGLENFPLKEEVIDL